MIDEEVKRIVLECEARARDLITGNMDRFEAIAKNLIERETLNAEEINLIMEGKALPQAANNHDTPEPAPAESS